MLSPVDAVVVVGPTEELDLLEGDGAGEGAGDGWVEAQERVERRGACWNTFSLNQRWRTARLHSGSPFVPLWIHL